MTPCFKSREVEAEEQKLKVLSENIKVQNKTKIWKSITPPPPTTKWNPSHCPKPGANNNPILPPAHFSLTYPVQSPYRELHTSYLCLAQAPLNVTWKLPSRPFPLNPKFSTQGRWGPRISLSLPQSILHSFTWTIVGKAPESRDPATKRLISLAHSQSMLC